MHFIQTIIDEEEMNVVVVGRQKNKNLTLSRLGLANKYLGWRGEELSGDWISKQKVKKPNHVGLSTELYQITFSIF